MIAVKCLVALFFLLSSCIAGASMDAMELALLEPYEKEIKLRWENDVIDRKYWQGGVKPKRFSAWNLQGIHLRPSEMASFILPAYEQLKLYHPDHLLNQADFDITMSNGSGLEMSISQTYVHQEQQSVYVSLYYPKPVVIHIRSRSKTLEAAVFISQRQKLPAIAPYRTFRWSADCRAGISSNILQLPELFCKLDANQTQSISIEGPARVKVKTRLQYEPSAQELIQNYHIRYQLNDKKFKWLHFSTHVETGSEMYVNFTRSVLGKEQSGFIEIPKGKHRLSVASDRNVYFQLLEQKEHDYLLSQLNQLDLSVATIRKQGLLLKQPLINSQRLTEDLIRNNTFQQSALVGQQQFHREALNYLHYPAGLKKSAQLLGQQTYYRSLLPSQKQSRKKQFKAYFKHRRLATDRTSEPKTFVAEQHLERALKQLPSTYFIPLETSNPADVYLLTRQYSPGFLRFVVDKRQCAGQQFKVQVDHQKPTLIAMNCLSQIDDEKQFSPSLASIGMEKILQTGEKDTRSARFASILPPAKLIPAGVVEFPIAENSRIIKVWRVDHEKAPLNVGIQIKASKSFELSEHGLLALLNHSDQQNLLALFIQHLSGRTRTTAFVDQSWMNQWVPLKRLLLSHYNQFKSLAIKPEFKQSVISSSQLKAKQQQAKKLEANQHWIKALEKWSEIVDSSKGLTQDRAKLSQVRILNLLSEPYLAETILRSLVFYAESSVANQAAIQLQQVYQQRSDKLALQKLSIVMFIRQPNQFRLQALMEALYDNKYYREVLLLGLLQVDPVGESQMIAAYRLNWWQVFQQLLNKLPESRQLFWAGMKAQKSGDFEFALTRWKQPEHVEWKKQLQRGLNIREGLGRTGLEKKYGQWREWQQSHPGNTLFQDATEWIVDSAGADQLYMIERDKLIKGHRAENERPVTIEVLGPLTLKFLARPLHPKKDDQSVLEGWLTIIDNDNDFKYPYFNNQPSQGIQLWGRGSYQPGNPFELEYHVGQGIHKIQLSSSTAPISLTVSQFQNYL